MGTGRKTTPRRGTTIGDSDADRWLRGDECGFFQFHDESFFQELWRSNRDDIIQEHVDEFPGTRPQRGWEFDSKEPRKRLGGIGTVASDVLNYVQSFQFGLPLMWVSEFDVAYYTGVAVDVNGKLINPNPSGTFAGKAIDVLDPPTYESQSSYLDRLGLFLPNEKKRLKKADFEPETIEYVS